MFTSSGFEANSHSPTFSFPSFLIWGLSPFLPVSQLLNFRPVSESACLKSNWQNWQKRHGTADSVVRLHHLLSQMMTYLHLPLKKIERSLISRFAMPFNCYHDLWNAFNNPSMTLLGFWFLRSLFFQKPEVCAEAVFLFFLEIWETYLSPVLSWMLDAQRFLLAEFNWVVSESTSFHPSTPTQGEDSVVCRTAFLLQKLFFICLFVHFSILNFYLTLQWTVSNPAFL